MVPRLVVQGSGRAAIAYAVERFIAANYPVRGRGQTQRRNADVREVAHAGMGWWEDHPADIDRAKRAMIYGIGVTNVNGDPIEWLVDRAIEDPRFSGVGYLAIIIFLVRRPLVRLILALLFEYLLSVGGVVPPN